MTSYRDAVLLRQATWIVEHPRDYRGDEIWRAAKVKAKLEAKASRLREQDERTNEQDARVADVLVARRKFTASEIAVLQSRYPRVVAMVGVEGASRHDHEQSVRGACAVLLHGAAIVDAPGIENTTACPSCVAALTGRLGGVRELDAEIAGLQVQDRVARGRVGAL